MNADSYVRLCEVCGAGNPPDEVRCTCGALLAHIDLTVRRAEAVSDAAASAGAVDTAAQEWISPGGQVLAAPSLPTPVRSAASNASIGLRCPHADCAMPNPPGSVDCVYCNRPLLIAAGLPVGDAAVPRIDGAVVPTDAALPPIVAAPPTAAALALAPVDFAAVGRPPPAPPSGPLRRLPAALDARYRIVRPLATGGSEADLFLVVAHDSNREAVAKVYRQGIAPKSEVLARLKNLAGRPVAELIDFGVSEGHAWELIEYCAFGSLREWLAAGPRSRGEVLALVRELSGALEAIHAVGILHRDLKPENVLVRSRDPLTLALTDFGSAALQRGTQHFTHAARTTMYAAPETLAGIIDRATDWWALGMIVLEAASGRHPFAGLSDLVIAQRLATMPVKIDGILDDRLLTLCAGLLMRDPKRRWKHEELARWLAGDVTLSRQADIAGSAVRAYRIGAVECATPAELAAALATHWDDALKDLARGSIVQWLDGEWHDQNLTRRVHDVLEHRGDSEERKLLACLILFDDRLPPVWRGQPLNRQALLAASGKAPKDGALRDWLVSLYADDVLSAWGAAGQRDLARDLAAIGALWKRAAESFRACWKAFETAVREAKKAGRSIDGSTAARVVDFDAAVYGQGAAWTAPPLASVLPGLLAVILDASQAARLRQADDLAVARLLPDCPWLAALPAVDAAERGAQLGAEPAANCGALLARRHILPLAEAEAKRAQLQRANAAVQRQKNLEEAEQRMLSGVRSLLAAVRDDEPVAARQLTDRLFGEMAQATALTDGSPVADRLRDLAQAFSFALPVVLQRLDELEHRQRIVGIWMRPARLVLMLVIVSTLFTLAGAAIGLLCAVGFAGWLGWLLKDAARSRAALAAAVDALHGARRMR